MNEPRRLLDDPSSSDEEKQLLGALLAPTVLADPTRSAVAARVTKSLAVPAAATKLLSLKALGVAAGVVAGGAALSFALLTSHKTESRAPVTNPPAVVRVPPQAPPKAEVSQAVEAPPAPAPPSTPKSSSSRQAARADTLALEETLLEQARSAIGTPSRALALLHEHERRFPNGMLTAERLYLTAQAHSRAGNQEAARRYAKLLQARFPKSTYLEQLRSLL
jgi:hypothetical protein